MRSPYINVRMIYIMSDSSFDNKNYNRFAQLPEVNVPRSKFGRSFTNKLVFNSGLLVPFFFDEVLPGDTMDLDFSMVARTTTAVCPVMDNLHIDTFFFFVPNRLVWDHWQAFCGEKVDPDDSTDYTVPKVVSSSARTNNLSDWFSFSNESSGAGFGSLWDYFGIAPLDTAHGVYKVSALPFRAYNLIWNTFFRDQNLQDRAFEVRYDEDRSAAYYNLLPRAKRHDYFTSCLPWPQLPPGATLPIASGTVPVFGNGMSLGLTNGTQNLGFNVGNSSGDMYAYTGAYGQTLPYATGDGGGNASAQNALGVTPDADKSGLVADVSSIKSVSINDLRTAFALQRWLETAAISGQRYTEILRGFFGVECPDYRLQRPEYLGGSMDYINLHQVAQTSATSETPQGHLTAYGYHSSNVKGFTKSFTEHGLIIGMVNVWTDQSYQQGIERYWLRNTRNDFYWMQFAHIGEQSVYQCELYADPNASEMDMSPFGYQERHAEYRYHPNMICGLLRSQANQGLDSWHYAEYFENAPQLNSEFIRQNDSALKRTLAVTNEPQIYLDAYFNYKCTRPMPLFGRPGLDRL